VTDARLDHLLGELAREQREADRLYNDALTRLDRALEEAPAFPAAPPAYDESKLPSINQAWNILPAGPPPIDGSIKGRLRGLIWRLVGPPLTVQREFNAALVDHLNRNVTAHREAAGAVSALIAVTRGQVERLIRFEQLLLQYLQTITLYVDTKDRAVGGQAQVLNAGLGALADDWLKRWESLAAREARFFARIATLDEVRATAAAAQQASLALTRELERLEGARQDHHARPGVPDAAAAAVPPGQDRSSFKYVGFENAFRGSPAEIRARLADYVPRFAGVADVVELGSGRGEFLDLLRERGILARGVDINPDMVEAARALGLDVAEADALVYLQGLADRSIGGVFAAQVIEHFEPAYLMRLLDAMAHKLRPGGLVVLETINPACWSAFFESYIRDLTHVRPIHPDTLQYLLRASGFRDVEIQFRSPVDEASRLQPIAAAADAPLALADLVDTFNTNVEKLNARMFSYQDYAASAKV
jgi:O-antigen chain-terminating methyltransferase